MRREGKGLRALGAALLLASVTIAAPTLSAAQEGASAPVETAEPAESAPEPAAAGSQEGAGAGGAESDSEGGQANDPADTGAVQEAEQAYAPAAPAAPATSGQAKSAASATVSTGDNFYSPATVTVNVGDTVTWRNTGAAQHSATANDGSFDTGIFGPGASRSQTFNRAGTFSYFCVVHGASQSGTVRVNAVSGGGGGGAGDPPSSGGSEAAAVASPGAAGSSTSLPATGFAALAMALVGILLTASGVLVGRAAGRGDAGARHRGRRWMRSRP